MPWYASGDEIREQLRQLAGNCGSADAEFSTKSKVSTGSAAGQQVDIDVFRVRGRAPEGGDANLPPKVKAMFVYGEHARELISPESALHFAKTLCGQGSSAGRASKVLDTVEFTIVPNANPIARKEVEAGNYCKRTNEDGTDLNRNWGSAHRDESLANSQDEMNPGPYGFSAPETQLLKELLEELHPDIYLSIHSGAYLLGTPYGYTMDKTPKDLSEMEEVLRPISAQYCGGECPFGDLAQLIHYKNFGCDIDYVYETIGSPYAFTWEIYVGESFRGRYIDEAHDRSLLQQAKRGGIGTWLGDSIGLLQQGRRGGLRGRMQMGEDMESPEKDQNPEECINQFLPKTEQETRSVVENWSGAYLTLCEEVVAKRTSAQVKQDSPAGNSGVDGGPAPAPKDPLLALSGANWEKAMLKELGP